MFCNSNENVLEIPLNSDSERVNVLPVWIYLDFHRSPSMRAFPNSIRPTMWSLLIRKANAFKMCIRTRLDFGVRNLSHFARVRSMLIELSEALDADWNSPPAPNKAKPIDNGHGSENGKDLDWPTASTRTNLSLLIIGSITTAEAFRENLWWNTRSSQIVCPLEIGDSGHDASWKLKTLKRVNF